MPCCGAHGVSSRPPLNADDPRRANGFAYRMRTTALHDGSDARAMSYTMPGERRGTMDGDSMMGGALLAEAGAPGGSSFGQLVTAFQEVAAGVEGTHRALIERVEHLTRELESMRSRNAEPIACDGEVTLETLERRSVVATLESFGGHRDRSARALGIGVRTLGMKLRQWKLAGLVPEHL